MRVMSDGFGHKASVRRSCGSLHLHAMRPGVLCSKIGPKSFTSVLNEHFFKFWHKVAA